MMNARTDDETLSAYIDDELPADEMEALVARLATEPALAERLEQLRAADDSIRDVYARLSDAPMPQGVVDLLDSIPDAPADRAPDNVVPLPRPQPRQYAVPLALAASVALLAGMFIGNQLQPNRGPDSTATASLVGPETGLYRLLEEEVSARPVNFADGGSGQVVLSFQSGDGYCRQFQVDGPDGTMQGLACRGDDGWRMDTVSYSDRAGGGYQQASGTVSAALAAAVEARLGGGDPLDSETESVLISNSWKNFEP